MVLKNQHLKKKKINGIRKKKPTPLMAKVMKNDHFFYPFPYAESIFCFEQGHLVLVENSWISQKHWPPRIPVSIHWKTIYVVWYNVRSNMNSLSPSIARYLDQQWAVKEISLQQDMNYLAALFMENPSKLFWIYIWDGEGKDFVESTWQHISLGSSGSQGRSKSGITFPP